MHDATAQTLVALQLQVLHLKGLLDDSTFAGKLADVEGTINELHEEIRAICLLSSMPPHERGLLPAALRRMAKRFGDSTGLDIDVRTKGSSAGLPVDLKISLYRIAQEALANVHRHAHANEVRIQLEATPQHLKLVVSDDGVGVAMDQLDRAPGVGIENVRRRVRELKGKFDLRPAKRGSEFIVTVPLPCAAA